MAQFNEVHMIDAIAEHMVQVEVQNQTSVSVSYDKKVVYVHVDGITVCRVRCSPDMLRIDVPTHEIVRRHK